MKKLIQYTLAFGALFMAATAQAQTDTTQSEQEIVIDNGKVKIVLKEKKIIMDGVDGSDTIVDHDVERVEIKVGDETMEIHTNGDDISFRDTEDMEELNEEMEELKEELAELEEEMKVEFKDFESLEDLEDLEDLKDLCEDDEPDFIETDWFNFQLGLNNLLNVNDELVMPEGYETLELSTGKSINFQVNVVQQAVNIYREKIRLVYGVGVDFNNYRFKNDIDLVEDSDPLEVELSTVNYKKNKLVVQYLSAPVKLDLRIGKDADEALTLAFGPHFQYLIGSHQRKKWNDNGNHKTKIRNDYNLEKFRMGWEAQFGYGSVVLYGKYFPESIFRAGKGPDLRTVSVGILIGGV